MNKYILVLGDILVIVLITLIGFATHGEVGASSLHVLPRMAAVFFPLSISWFVLAPSLGLFQRETTIDPKQLWRPVLAAFFAAPLAVIVRGFLLSAPVIPIFAVVLATTSALGMLIWRATWYWITRRTR